MFSNDNQGGGAQDAPAPSSAPQSRLARVIGALSYAASIVSSALVVLTLAMTGFSVFRRYVLGRPLTWSDELSGFLVVAIVMLGAAEVFRRGEHVSVDILTEKATGKKRKALDLWSNISVSIVMGVLFFSALNAVQFSRMFGVYSDGYLEAPLWIPQSFLLVGSGLLFAMAVVRCLDIIFIRSHKS